MKNGWVVVGVGARPLDPRTVLQKRFNFIYFAVLSRNKCIFSSYLRAEGCDSLQTTADGIRIIYRTQRRRLGGRGGRRSASGVKERDFSKNLTILFILI